jgi:hypothetical protein
LGSPAFDAGYCHCRISQLTAGAPIMAFATVPRSDFLIKTRNPIRRRSSNPRECWFCADCGMPLGVAVAVGLQPDMIDFAIATLDDPAGVRADNR